MQPLLYAFLLGLVAACGFQPIGWWPLSVAGFAGLLWLVARAPSLRSALARGWWFAVGHFCLGLNWIATAFTFQSNMPAWLGWIAVVLLSCYLAVYPAMAAGLAWRGGQTLSPSGERREPQSGGRRGDEAPNLSDAPAPQPSPLKGRGSLSFVLAFAAAWIVTEWLRATVFTGFIWNPAGVALLDTPFAAAAPLVGTYGLSGILMLIAGALFAAAQRERRSVLVLLLPLAALALGGPLVRGDPPPPTATPLRIVQPNVGQQDRWREGFEEEALRRVARLSGAPIGRPRLLLWPESAIVEPLQDGRADPYYRRRAALLAERAASVLGPGDLLLTGGLTFRSADGERLTSATNSVFALAPGGRILARYDKAHLVPYGEYLPARPLLSALGLSRLAPGDVDFDSGPGPVSLDLPLAGRVGFQLCYEIIFSGQVVEDGRRPAFIFNPSNDAWFGAFGPPQHLAQARLRALEEGLPVLRSTPTGISAVIDAHGRLVASLPWRTAGVIDARLPAPVPPTPFARYGNLLPFLFALLLAAAAIAVRRKAR